MMGYTPPFEITEEILGLVSEVSEKVGRITERKGLENKPRLRRNNRIRSVHASLRIEANGLSLGEVRDVIDGKTVMGPSREIREVQNAYEAYDELADLDPYSAEELKRVHGIMTRGLIEETGMYRRGEEGVFNGDRCVFMAPPVKMVPALMQDLFAWMEKARGSLHPLILSAVFHYEFVFIHPFADGNGRIARLWHTALLSRWKPIFEYIPLESRIERFQEDYYGAIAACHGAGSSTAFIVFMLHQINAALDEVLRSARTEGEDVSEYEKRLLSVMEYDIPYTANTLLQLLDLRSRDTLRLHYLEPAIRHGLVAMTLPETPRSRNQRYIKR